MKKFFYLLLFLTAQQAFAQTVPSSCTAPDSILKKYIVDADLMASKRMANTNYADSVVIPQGWTDTTLRAMIAVYNATSLPARDSVVAIHKLHNVDTAEVRLMFIIADSMQSYMMQMKAGIMPTGFAPFDSLVDSYHLHLNIYIPMVPQFPGDHAAVLYSDSSYNMAALADSFATLPGLNSAGPGFFYFVDSMAITDTVTPNYVALDYRYSWGNCNPTCQYSHTWHFRVAYNCDVTYVGWSGDPFPVVGIQDIHKKEAAIYPNPATDLLHISASLKTGTRYSIYNMQSQLMATGTTTGDIDIHHLSPGHYFIRVYNQDIHTTATFIKE